MRTRATVVLAAAVLLAGCANAAEVADDATVEAAASSPNDGQANSGGKQDGSGSDKEDNGSSNSSSGSRLRLPNVVGPRPVFLTPSRNIGCAISSDTVRCDIIERSYVLPVKPDDCTGDFGRSLSVGVDGSASFVCVSDTVIDQGAPVLPYGASTEVGDFGCTSSEAHIACYHLESDHGFELSRESPALF